MHEVVNYTFTEDEILIQSESVKSDIKWEMIWKAPELKDWFLIYHNKVSANMIPKRCKDETQLNVLKDIISNYANIKRNY